MDKSSNPKKIAHSPIAFQRRNTIPLITDDTTNKIFAIFKSRPGDSTISLDNLVAGLQECGLRLTDPRLKHFVEGMNSLKTREVDAITLERVMGNDNQLIATALKHMLIVPDFPAFCQHIEEIFNELKSIEEGNVATYIPALAAVDPKHWGCSVCTVDGQRFSIGDSLVPFTFQSCSKPLTYALALKLLGRETVHQYIGQEPSGRPFNSIVLDNTDKPHNPMINPGAIVICALLHTFPFENLSIDEMCSKIIKFFEELAADESIGYSDEVYVSEKSTGFRNSAIAYLMKEKAWFPTVTVDDVLSLYFKTCSILGNCEILSLIASTLANGGVCPLTNKLVIKQDVVRCVLSLMQSCGMYDYSGQFSFLIGLPAKSGVSGAVMIVVPSVMGIATWSPRLDINGNSSRGLQFCKSLLNYYCLHPYAFLGHADPEQEDLTKRPRRQQEVNVMRVLFAASRGDIDALRCYYLRSISMDVIDYDGRTALHVAASEGHLECVRFLVETCGVTLDPRDRYDRTPLQDAQDFDQPDVASFLRCVGASI